MFLRVSVRIHSKFKEHVDSDVSIRLKTAVEFFKSFINLWSLTRMFTEIAFNKTFPSHSHKIFTAFRPSFVAFQHFLYLSRTDVDMCEKNSAKTLADKLLKYLWSKSKVLVLKQKKLWKNKLLKYIFDNLPFTS